MMAASHAARAARGLVGACLGTGAGMTPPIAAAMPVLGAAASLGAAAQNALVARFSTNHKVFKGYATTTTAEGETQQGKGGSRRRENVDTSGFAGMRGDERLYHVNGIDFPVSMEEILTGQVELPEDFDVETHFGSWEESERPRPDLVERYLSDEGKARSSYRRTLTSRLTSEAGRRASAPGQISWRGTSRTRASPGPSFCGRAWRWCVRTMPARVGTRGAPRSRSPSGLRKLGRCQSTFESTRRTSTAGEGSTSGCRTAVGCSSPSTRRTTRGTSTSWASSGSRTLSPTSRSGAE